MTRSCCVFGCSNRDTKEKRLKGIKFYRIPGDKEKRQKWPGGVLLITRTWNVYSVSKNSAFIMWWYTRLCSVSSSVYKNPCTTCPFCGYINV